MSRPVLVPLVLGGILIGANALAPAEARAQEGDAAAEEAGIEGLPDDGADDDSLVAPDDLQGWGVGGEEKEGRFKPQGKTGKLKEVEEEEEEAILLEQTPIDLGPPGFAYVDTVLITGGSIVVPVQQGGVTEVSPAASYVIGVGYRIKDRWEVSARFGISNTVSNGPLAPYKGVPGARDPDEYTRIATGGVELAFKPYFQVLRSLVLSGGLAFTIPTGMGDAFPDPDERGQLGEAISNMAAAASRGWQDRALFSHGRFGITPSFGLIGKWDAGPGKVTLDTNFKGEILILTGGNEPPTVAGVALGELHDVALNFVHDFGAAYELFGGLLIPGLDFWWVGSTATESYGSLNNGGTTFVFEPHVETRVPFDQKKTVGLDAHLGFILPLAGTLAGKNAYSASIWGLRLNAGLFF